MTDKQTISPAIGAGTEVQMNISPSFAEGQDVYLNDHYYADFQTSIINIPKYGWKIKALVDSVATIEYQSRNLKLLMTLMLDVRYLRKEV